MASFAPSSLATGARTFSRSLARWFPPPELLLPPAAGIDISDTSLKWIVFEKGPRGTRVRTFGEAELQPGIVVNGAVENVPALAQALALVKKELHGIECVHAALPEEAAYVFGMHVPEGSSREQALSVIEFELEGRVPISPAAAIFDFDVILRHDGGTEVGVVVFSRELAESYARAFADSGLCLLSLELESRSAARAVSTGDAEEPVTLLVDFGRLRAGLAVLKRGIPIFTSTVMVGGETIDRALVEKLSLSPEELNTFKNERGLLSKDEKYKEVVEAMTKATSALADEIVRHHHYWDTRRNRDGERVTPVERVLLVGGSANIKGVSDFLAGKVQTEVIRPNVWQRVCSFDDYIPPIDRRISLEYATAIGLALRSM